MTAAQDEYLLCSQVQGSVEGGRSGPVIGLLEPVIQSGQGFPGGSLLGISGKDVFFCCCFLLFRIVSWGHV